MTIIGIVGPTASGKTGASIALAELLGGRDRVEIISADAMQLYRGMDVGTAKVTASEARGIRHHQIDVLDISESASVAAYQRHARKDLADIEKRGRTPLVVGGSGLYVSGLLDELRFPGWDPLIRGQLEWEWEKDPAALRAELRATDFEAYRHVDLCNPRRVIRALEVIRLTGERFTPVFPRHTFHYPDVRIFGIHRPKDELEAAIATRTQQMLAGGLIEETQALLDRGLRTAPTAARATGYREAIAVIDGRMSIEEAGASISRATRRLAKKQRTWFGADPRIEWINPERGNPAEQIAELLA